MRMVSPDYSFSLVKLKLPALMSAWCGKAEEKYR